MKRFATLLTGAVAALLLAGPAQAAPFPWKYNWTPSSQHVGNTPSSTTWLEITNEPLDPINQSPISSTTASGNTDIVAAQITVHSDAPVGFPDEFTTAPNLNLTLKITDLSSPGNPSGSFLFTGTFNTQNVSDPSTAADSAANVKFKLLSSLPPPTTIGQNVYTLTYNGYVPPGPPSSGNKGSIGFHVSVRALDIQKAPEPSTMLLAGLGASFLSLGAWRKRRQLKLETA